MFRCARRGDRAIELTKAFEFSDADFPHFDRVRHPDVRFAGMLQYDGDSLLPKHYVVPPPTIDKTVGEYLANAGLKQLAISETQKYGHVTYFFNGNKTGKFAEELERYIEIPSYKEPEDERPWMRCVEITDETIAQLDDFEPDFIRLNYPNGDMVGHTASYNAARMAMEAVDIQCKRLVEAIVQRGGVAVVTADHGNCDQMAERDKAGNIVDGDQPEGWKGMTAHTLAPTPVAIVGGSVDELYEMSGTPNPGLANVTGTCVNLLGFEVPAGYEPSLIKPMGK